MAATMVLTSDGDSWRGTYEILVARAAEDLLMEGPLDGVEVRTDSRAVRGTLSYANRDLLIVDGIQIQISDIVELHVD